ncbi:deoxyribonuclease V [Tenacibaculum sp. nBUS_03]|uniref:deoxyribonuclease V n=1 Tax=Tenacibaculum sp. nBUS_03 TaxID=3395320 RepID=UPI003EBFE623
METTIVELKYYPFKIEKTLNTPITDNIEVIEGVPFTGVKLYRIKETGSLFQTNFINGVRNGVSIVKSKDSITYYMYSNNSLRLMFGDGYRITEKEKVQETILTYYYDDLEIENIVVQNGKNIVKESIGINSSFDREKLLEKNKDVLDKIKRYDIDDTSELETFVWSSYNVEDLDSLKEIYRKGQTGLAYFIKKDMEEGNYNEEFDLLPFYLLQNEMKGKVIKKDMLKDKIKYIAGVDVAYNELDQVMVGAVVVMNAVTLEIVDESFHKMNITFPYIPGLFSFREVPSIIEAYKKLRIIPDLIICDGQGIAHPKGVGMATHLGVELNIPTIGCAKKRLIGYYEKEKLGNKRGEKESIIWNDEEVGVVLRTQENVKPMFVSIGHKISLQSSIDWVMKLTPNYRLPETIRKADQLVNKILKKKKDN